MRSSRRRRPGVFLAWTLALRLAAPFHLAAPGDDVRASGVTAAFPDRVVACPAPAGNFTQRV